MRRQRHESLIVREVLIVPLLAALGFSEAPPYRIIRSKRLEHPFVYIGTAKNNAWLHIRCAGLNVRTLVKAGLTRAGGAWALA